MHSRLMSWSRYLYLAGIVLALVAVIPTAWFPFQLGKVALFALLLLPVAIFFVAGGGARELLRAHGARLVLLVAVLPVVYLLSALVSRYPLAFTGFSVETDTVLFIVLAFLAFLFSFTLFRTLRTAHLLTRTVFWGLVVAAVFQFFVIIFGTGFLPDIFNDRSVNLIGKWNDLGLMFGLLALMLVASLEFGSMDEIRRIGLTVALAVLGLLLAVINFSLVWALILAFSLGLAGLKFLSTRSRRSDSEVPLAPGSQGGVPWFALGAASVSVAMLFFGANLSQALTSMFPVVSLEVRPSYSSTIQVINAAREGASEMFVGSGPNSFGEMWIAHKPAEVNQSAFWNFDFNVGFSTLLTAFGTVGFLGVLAWLVPVILVLVALVRAVRFGVLSREERIVATTLGIGALFLFATLIFYVPSQNIILLALTFCGAAFGFLWRQGRSSNDEAPSRLLSMFAGVCAIALILVSLWGAAVVGRRALAASFVQGSAAALNSGELDTAQSLAARARGVEQNSDTLRLAVDMGLVRLQQLAQTEATAENTATLQADFATIVQETAGAGQELLTLAPYDYRSHLSMARVYDLLTALGVQGAFDSASAAYVSAAELNPTNPTIPLSQGRLVASQNNLTGAGEFLTRALTLKPNYTDAMLFVVQLSVAQNDLATAVNAAAAAAQTAPGVAPIWFQLGLLLYAAGDTTNAVPAFEQAVALVPDYANAKYFLGLAYADTDRTADSIRQFEDIARTNPDNAEVQLILGNLRLGKEPFEGVEPPPTPPEERAEAPVSE